jgi:hypothetical protein
VIANKGAIKLRLTEVHIRVVEFEAEALRGEVDAIDNDDWDGVLSKLHRAH